MKTTTQTTETRQGQFVKEFTPTDGIEARKHRKENHFQQEWVVISFEDGKFRTPLTLRTYGTDRMNYACFWLNDNKNSIYASGSGSAGGYGYHRPSAAADEALETAGITLNKRIGGVGDSAIEEALTAIAERLGITNFYIHKAHA